MSNGELRKIGVDDILESAATGVLRALDARARSSGGGVVELNAQDLIRSGFSIDLLLRCGGVVGPIEVVGRGTTGPRQR